MSEFLELRQVVAGLIGALIALLLQALTRKAARSRTAGKLSVSFWEELKAVNFYDAEGKPNFAGFSSQTFDSLFREVAETLPESLARDLMRYHWRMKYLEEMKPITMRLSGGVQTTFYEEARDLRERLLVRLEHYADRSWIGILFRSRETCPKQLLQPTSKS